MALVNSFVKSNRKFQQKRPILSIVIDKINPQTVRRPGFLKRIENDVLLLKNTVRQSIFFLLS